MDKLVKKIENTYTEFRYFHELMEEDKIEVLINEVGYNALVSMLFVFFNNQDVSDFAYDTLVKNTAYNITYYVIFNDLEVDEKIKVLMETLDNDKIFLHALDYFKNRKIDNFLSWVVYQYELDFFFNCEVNKLIREQEKTLIR